jgi:EAL domain-containing protein (putative c-di-GMP-specific phosphodiesterase class I)
VHQIKIDRSFVNNMDTLPANYTIVESAIFLSKGLQCSVVAEGVETQSINDKLVEMDCDHLQGYLHGRPQPLAEHIRASIERGLMSA